MNDQARKALERIIAKKESWNRKYYQKILRCGIFDYQDDCALLTSRGRVVKLKSESSHDLILALSDLIYWNEYYLEIALLEAEERFKKFSEVIQFAGIKEAELNRFLTKCSVKFQQSLKKKRFPIDYSCFAPLTEGYLTD